MQSYILTRVIYNGNLSVFRKFAVGKSGEALWGEKKSA